MVESDSDLEDKINLQYHDGNNTPYLVPWKNFYFDAENANDYSRLLKYLTRQKVYHPICVVGFIKSIDEYRIGKYCLKMEVVSDEENRRIVIELYFESIKIYDELISRGNYKIIVYTKFRFYREKEWIAPNDKKLDEENYSNQGSHRSKSVYITDEGIQLAKKLLIKYQITDWEN